MGETYLTKDGLAKLQAEHKSLLQQKRQLTEEVSKAAAMGDLRENAEYHAARERQSFNEGRIKEIEDKLARAEIIDPTKLSGERVAFGATVKLLNTETEDEVVYRIVGADESNISAGQISITSPVARSLLGKEAGDEVKIRTPGGERVYEILEVEFK